MDARSDRLFPIVLGCDCDPDRPNFGGPPFAGPGLAWRGNVLGIERFRRTRERFAARTGLWPKMTWFVRADYQVARVHGDAGYCLGEFGEQWQALEQEGDEIAWHPHLWAWDESHGWHQSVGDAAFADDCLSAGFDGFVSVWGRPPRAVHAGWCYQDTATLAFLAGKGIVADCSAVPGHNTLGRSRLDQSDWSRAPTRPYYPSASDYQRAVGPGDARLDILEVPASVGSHWYIGALKMARFQARHGTLRVNRNGFANQVPLIALHPWLNGPVARDALRRTLRESAPYFWSYCHSDEFLATEYKSGYASRLHDIAYLFVNLERIVTEIRAQGYAPAFMTVSTFVGRHADIVNSDPSVRQSGAL